MDRLVVRPQAPRVVAYIAGGALVAMFVALWVAFPPAIREQFTVPQVVTLIGLLGVALGVLHAIARSRVEADARRLVVVNGYRKHTVAWSEVDAVGYKDGAPWPEIRLKDGGRVILMAIQSADGTDAKRAVARLRAYLG